MKGRLAVCLMLGVLCVLSVRQVRATDFSGERLVYAFGWQKITAAKATVTVDTFQSEGRSFYKIQFNINGEPKLDFIWKIRDVIKVETDAQTLQCRHFMFMQREGNFRQDTNVWLEPGAGMLVSERVQYKTDNEKKTLAAKSAPVDNFDPISALYYVRRMPMTVGQVNSLKVFDGKRQHVLNYTVLKEERITTSLGTFDTWKVEPRIVPAKQKDTESKVEKVKDVFLWIDKQEPHNVVRIESEAFVGRIFAELVEAK